MDETPPTAHASPGIERVPATALVLLAISSVQFGAAISTEMFDELGPSGGSLLRVALAAIVLLVLWRPSVRGRSAAQWRAVTVFGLTLGVMNTVFYEALARLPLGTAVTIEFVGPLGLAVLLSRRAAHVLVALVAALGIVLITDPLGAGADGAGVAFALAAGLCWAGYILAAQRASALFSGSDGVALAMTIAVLAPLVPGLWQGGGALLEPHLLGIGLVAALLSSVIPYSLETEALRRIDARVFGVLMSLEPAFAALAGLLLLGQRLSAVEYAGMALVVGASIAVTRTQGTPPG